MQQGNAQQGFGQQQDDGRGLRQGGVQPDRAQQGNDRNNNFGQRDNGQYGNNYGGNFGQNNYGQRDYGQYGNNYGGNFGQNNNYGQRDNGQYGNNYGGNFGQNNNYGQRDNGQYGNNTTRRNFDQNEFNRRYYGRYGYDPNNFQRNRLRYRAEQRWRERYPHDYVYADDSFYRDCQSNNEVGGAIIGAILGGLLGNSVSQGNGGATLAGLILGGVGGATLARNLDCEDRSYVYRTYYDGFERGRPRASYPWRNDRTGNYGTLVVGDYYRDRDNYRCATYSQTIYVRGTPQVARGHACRQDDGTWAIVD